jgi:hypothetical protein
MSSCDQMMRSCGCRSSHLRRPDIGIISRYLAKSMLIQRKVSQRKEAKILSNRMSLLKTPVMTIF